MNHIRKYVNRGTLVILGVVIVCLTLSLIFSESLSWRGTVSALFAYIGGVATGIMLDRIEVVVKMPAVQKRAAQHVR